MGRHCCFIGFRKYLTVVLDFEVLFILVTASYAVHTMYDMSRARRCAPDEPSAEAEKFRCLMKMETTTAHVRSESLGI